MRFIGIHCILKHSVAITEKHYRQSSLYSWYWSDLYLQDLSSKFLPGIFYQRFFFGRIFRIFRICHCLRFLCYYFNIFIKESIIILLQYTVIKLLHRFCGIERMNLDKEIFEALFLWFAYLRSDFRREAIWKSLQVALQTSYFVNHPHVNEHLWSRPTIGPFHSLFWSWCSNQKIDQGATKDGAKMF